MIQSSLKSWSKQVPTSTPVSLRDSCLHLEGSAFYPFHRWELCWLQLQTMAIDGATERAIHSIGTGIIAGGNQKEHEGCGQVIVDWSTQHSSEWWHRGNFAWPIKMNMLQKVLLKHGAKFSNVELTHLLDKSTPLAEVDQWPKSTILLAQSQVASMMQQQPNCNEQKQSILFSQIRYQHTSFAIIDKWTICCSDIVPLILGYVDAEGLCRLATTCKKLNMLTGKSTM